MALDKGKEHGSEVWGVWRLDDCQHLQQEQWHMLSRELTLLFIYMEW